MNFKVDISVCRVCMKSETGVSLFKDAALMEKFVYTTKLKVKAEDSLPGILCEKCVARLKLAHDFCRSANVAEKHLRQFISKISNDFQEVTKILPDHEEEEYIVMEDFETDEAENIISDEIISVPPVEEVRNLKTELVAEVEEEEEEEVEEEQQQPEENVVTKQEAFGSDIYMEEFQEIIQDDQPDTSLYLEEDSSQELRLYEETSDIFENEQLDGNEDMEVEGDIETQEVLSSTNEGEEKPIKTEPKKTKIRKYVKNQKRTSGESAASKIEGKSNICIKCNKDFSTKTNLMRHMSTHDGVKPYTCPTCGKGFTQNGSLKQHIFIHTGERPHVCKICQRGFTQSKSLIFHMRRHTGEKPFNCEKCEINFRQKDGLKHHMQKYHGEGQPKREPHVCYVCERVLSSKYALATHLKKHVPKMDEIEGGEEEDEVVNSKESLKKTIISQTHTETKVYSVRQLTADSTEVVSDEVEHKPISHAGAGLRMKQFQCGKCFKSFHIKRNLLRHLQNHDVNALELHQCTDCCIGFDTKRSLKLHRQRDHKDVIPDLNNCEYCNAPFVSVADLSEHIANEHDAIDQNCPHCNEHFESQKLYYDHLLEHEHLLDN